MTKHFILVSLLSLFITPFYAQNAKDYEHFVKDAGELSNIYRGHAPLEYNFFHSGTYYAYSENFEKGTLRFNGKTYRDVNLNLNSHLDELSVLIKESGRMVALNGAFVDNFSMGERHFINVKNVGQDIRATLPETGYYEVLYDGSAKLYKKIKKIYSERINEGGNSKTNSKLERVFLSIESRYLIKGNIVREIKNKSDILSCFKENKKAIKQFIRENNLDLRHDKDHSFTEVVRFVESGTTKKL